MCPGMEKEIKFITGFYIFVYVNGKKSVIKTKALSINICFLKN